MFKEKPFNILLFCSLLTVCTAVFQYLYPDLSYMEGGFVGAILLTVFLQKNLYTNLFGGISILLVVITAFYPHENLSTEQVMMRLGFSVIILVLTTISVLYVKKLYGNMESDKQQVTALFEFATEGIILTSQTGDIVLANPAALNLFGYSREELLGKPIEVLIPTRLHGKHVHYREGFYDQPSNRSMGHGRDLFAKTKDGKEFPVEVSLSYYKQKTEFFVIAFVVDIRQRKESEQRLIEQKEQLQRITEDIRKLNAELENKVDERTQILKEALQELERSQQSLHEALEKEKELSEIKSRFVSMASHEFRTPLSTVLSSASLISKYKKGEEQDNRDRHIKKIKDSVKHLNDLLEDFLSLGKLEEGKVQVSGEPFDLREFLEETADEIKGIAKPNQQLVVEYRGDNNFSTDKKVLKNILINLLSNAVKFSPDEATVWINTVVEDHEVTIAVKDEGIGISEEDQNYMFTSFFRGRNAMNIQGTGLGLHIVKRYTDLLGGIIQLQSTLGSGTTITVKLPELQV
ncbi:MAG: PAS domain-containing sensor histidine kinase [Candidatus Pseudobacter hemicellulosilyticus]|uniref:histidine kinase n=1 Tax=Candidatus Pseudobacter hemicellulosilyticus TaxID=3121375 RepID=A0AAJ6BG89_9BACT|nr:MAG: PAS domain-containing sensor histidine kinase [Pseudobacter sp.]